MHMDAKLAVATAKSYIQDLFGDEQISNTGLEEIQYEDVPGRWKITVGFTRPWDGPRNVYDAIRQATLPARSYKVVTISDEDGKVISVTNRDP